MDTAVAKQKEEAKAAAAKQKAEKKAAVLRKKYEQAMAAAQLKLDAATKAWENNKKILDDSETDAKTLKKTQAGLKEAEKAIAEAQKQLTAASKSHASTLATLAGIGPAGASGPGLAVTLDKVEQILYVYKYVYILCI